jgi:hypothetical protein
MRVVSLSLVLTLLSACSNPVAPRAAAPADHASEELDILEAVFRYQFEHNGASYMHPDRLFLSLAEAKDPPKDPPAALLARFKGQIPPVEPESAADTDMVHGVHAKGKQGRGVLLRLTNIRWIDDDTVEVDGGYYSSGLSASGNTYRAQRREGAWVVVSDTLHWVS